MVSLVGGGSLGKQVQAWGCEGCWGQAFWERLKQPREWIQISSGNALIHTDWDGVFQFNRGWWFPLLSKLHFVSVSALLSPPLPLSLSLCPFPLPSAPLCLWHTHVRLVAASVSLLAIAYWPFLKLVPWKISHWFPLSWVQTFYSVHNVSYLTLTFSKGFRHNLQAASRAWLALCHSSSLYILSDSPWND